MAFSYNNFDKLSGEANTNVRRIYAYLNADDTLATVQAADYFLPIWLSLSIGDWILVYGSDGYETIVVTASTSSTVTTATLTTVPANSITNNEISASAAIAFSKLAPLPSTQILVGSGTNVATARAMSGDVTINNLGATAIGAGKVLSSMVSPLLQQYASVALTAAEFNGMYAAPKLLVAAGGANTLIVVDKVELLMTYGSSNFAAGGVTYAQYDSTANGAGVIATSTLTAASFQAAVSTGFIFNGGVIPQTFTTTVNKGLYLSNTSGAFTTGNSTFVAHVWYKTIPTV